MTGQTFEQAALERIVASGVDARTVLDGTLRLEPFGPAFLLVWDGAIILSVDEVTRLLGATPARDELEPTPEPDERG